MVLLSLRLVQQQQLLHDVKGKQTSREYAMALKTLLQKKVSVLNFNCKKPFKRVCDHMDST